MEIGGVTFEPVAFAPGIDLPSPGDLFVARASLDPGAVVPIEGSDPAIGILLVESGTLTLQVEGPLMVTRGTGLGEAMATADVTGDFSSLVESVSAGQAVTLEAGDAAYIPANVAGEIRNEGQLPFSAFETVGQQRAATAEGRAMPLTSRCSSSGTGYPVGVPAIRIPSGKPGLPTCMRMACT